MQLILVSITCLFKVVFADENTYYRVNLAGLRNQTSQSNISTEKTSSLAVDGNIKTCFYVNQDPVTKYIWWIIELDRYYEITHIRLLYDVEPIYWENVLDMSALISNSTKKMYLCTTFRNKYIQYSEGYLDLSCESVIVGKFVTLAKKDSMLILCEVHIFAALKSVNLAYKRPLHYLFNFINAELTVDGDLSTCAAMIGSGKEDAFLRINLDSAYYVSDVNLHYIKIHKGIHVFVSNNEENNEELLCATTYDSPHDSSSFNDEIFHVQSLKCLRPLLGRFVTITKPRETSGDSFVLCDVTIYSRERSQGLITLPNPSCLSHEYKCLAGECIHNDWICDGTHDCPFADDEAPSCQVDKSLFKCKRKNENISISYRCDGIWQCSDYSDEEHCFDMEEEPLKATFEGESNLYVCSDGWTIKQSSDICNEYNRDYVPTKNVQISKSLIFIKLVRKRPFSDTLPFMSYFKKSQVCDSNEFVNVQCSDRKERAYICGKRGFSDGFLEQYIIGGHEAKVGAWPWIVQVVGRVNNLFFYCGGSLLNDRWILTAAHCLDKIRSTDYIYVKFGSNDKDDYYAEEMAVSHMINHPEYAVSPIGKMNDIALLRLKKRQSYTKYIRPICLPEKIMDNKTLASFQHCVIAGFGDIDRNGAVSTRLQQLRVNLIPTNACAEMSHDPSTISKNIEERKLFCAGQLPLTSGKSACKGDSGSPLVCKANNGIWTQIGVTRGSIQADRFECLCTLFVKVDLYLDFIHTVMKNTYSNKGRMFKIHVDILTILLINNLLF